ncbi:hypothetical protein D9756_004380 [Leucocoprinus leucothites]|uniref:Uncharacterized protein n=1 Tax=Leucocoprinus leucothites TaxID=201217 RepID=A0A8H5G0P3_9AGAR|nr:hypothetical protein D9756_004380 [Leucoagaricus leucothites]
MGLDPPLLPSRLDLQGHLQTQRPVQYIQVHPPTRTSDYSSIGLYRWSELRDSDHSLRQTLARPLRPLQLRRHEDLKSSIGLLASVRNLADAWKERTPAPQAGEDRPSDAVRIPRLWTMRVLTVYDIEFNMPEEMENGKLGDSKWRAEYSKADKQGQCRGFVYGIYFCISAQVVLLEDHSGPWRIDPTDTPWGALLKELTSSSEYESQVLSADHHDYQVPLAALLPIHFRCWPQFPSHLALFNERPPLQHQKLANLHFCNHQVNEHHTHFTNGAKAIKQFLCELAVLTAFASLTGASRRAQHGKRSLPKALDADKVPALTPLLAVDQLAPAALFRLGVWKGRSPLGYRMPPPTLSITVDEADWCRHSQESASAAANVDDDNESARLRSSFSRSTTLNMHDRDHLAASPIAEGDESKLFPLPSPRCSPFGSSGSSPQLSPWNSPRNSPGVSPKPSPGPSPNTPSLCLHPNSATIPAATLKEKARLRKNPATFRHHQSNVSKPRVNKLRLLSLTLNFPSMRKSSANAETVAPSNSNSDDDMVPNPPVSPSADTGLSSSLTPTLTRSSMASNRSMSPITLSAPMFLLSLDTNRKLFFGLPFLKAGNAIKGASTEVLRGVGSVLSGGGGLYLGSV